MDANQMEPWRSLEPFLGADVPRNEVVLLSDVKAMCATLTAELAEAREQRDSLRDECERLREALNASGSRVAYARDLLIGAVNDIENWAGYASEYFQRKHKLHDALAEYRGAIAGLAALSASGREVNDAPSE